MANPTCATGCSNTLENLPEFNFSRCAPVTHAGEIRRIFIGIPDNPFTDWKLATEWNARLTSNTATKLIALTVIGEKPKPTSNSRAISGGRTVQLEKDHSLTATIDETNDENHEAIRILQCGGTFPIWYETSGGLMFGGNEGITISTDADMIIPAASTDLLTYEIIFTWKAKFTEERIVSPIA